MKAFLIVFWVLFPLAMVSLALGVDTEIIYRVTFGYPVAIALVLLIIGLPVSILLKLLNGPR